MPPKKTPAQQPKGKGGAIKRSAGTAAASLDPPTLNVKRGSLETDEDLIPALAALKITASNPRRLRYAEKFKELTELILSSDASYRLNMRERAALAMPKRPLPTQQSPSVGASPAAAPLGDDYFPTLQVGFLARAMGLNLTEEQVVHLVELVEDDTASRGAVSRRRLEGVVIDALMTGVLGGPTLISAGVLAREQLPAEWQPSCCLRSDEDSIFRAFAAIDATGKGFVTREELRLVMTTMGDPFSTMEMEDMLIAMADPDSDAIYYRDFVTVLARE